MSFVRFRGTSSYLTGPSLEAAVNSALALERPLLVKGEPGTGKTLLASAIADALDLELIRWSVKSTTRAQDGLYIYDTVQRLYDARFGEGDVKDIRHSTSSIACASASWRPATRWQRSTVRS
jgi:MoxR-like ATPase